MSTFYSFRRGRHLREDDKGQAWLEIFSGNSSQRLLLSKFRIYDPTDGRFLQNEPLVDLRAFKHYLFVSQNPGNSVDPLGLQDDTCGCPQGTPPSPHPLPQEPPGVVQDGQKQSPPGAMSPSRQSLMDKMTGRMSPQSLNVVICKNTDFFKDKCKEAEPSYFVEVRSWSIGGKETDFGKGHTELGLIKTSAAGVQHSRIGLGPAGGPPIVALLSVGWQRGILYAKPTYAPHSRTVFQLSPEGYKALEQWIAGQRSIQKQGKLTWGRGTRVCTDFVLEGLEAAGIPGLRLLIDEKYSSFEYPAYELTTDKLIETLTEKYGAQSNPPQSETWKPK